MQGAFRSLGIYNYRLWAAGALVSNVGTWMQRTAQDWLVLTILTQNNATAVGVVMGLQFGPKLFLLPWIGLAADRYDRRRLLMLTQAVMGLLALGLGLLTVAGLVQVWHVYVFAGLLGCATAFDAPARQTFVSELVGEGELSNAVALNSASFNSARMIGPAVAGVLIHLVGCGWVFLINAASFLAVLASLLLMRRDLLHQDARATTGRGSFAAGLRYVWGRQDLRTILVMLFLIGTFGLNFPLFIATMAVSEFHAQAGQYGLLTSTLAVGSVAGALLAARRAQPHIALLVASAAIFGVGGLLASAMPNQWLFGLMLPVVGITAQTFITSTNSLAQLSSDPIMRGRVLALMLAIALGGTPFGSPIMGWIADQFGPRWSMGVGAASGLLAALVGLRYLIKCLHLRMDGDLRHPHLSLDACDPRSLAHQSAGKG